MRLVDDVETVDRTLCSVLAKRIADCVLGRCAVGAWLGTFWACVVDGSDHLREGQATPLSTDSLAGELTLNDCILAWNVPAGEMVFGVIELIESALPVKLVAGSHSSPRCGNV